jgi:organic hydroperoxide reductase OsmC/OhrA
MAAVQPTAQVDRTATIDQAARRAECRCPGSRALQGTVEVAVPATPADPSVSSGVGAA